MGGVACPSTVIAEKTKLSPYIKDSKECLLFHGKNTVVANQSGAEAGEARKRLQSGPSPPQIPRPKLAIKAGVWIRSAL